MKEIPITNNSNSNYDPGKETDPCEEIDEQITNKNTSGKPFLNLNYKELPSPYIVLKCL